MTFLKRKQNACTGWKSWRNGTFSAETTPRFTTSSSDIWRASSRLTSLPGPEACTIFMSSRRRYVTSFKAICPGRALAWNPFYRWRRPRRWLHCTGSRRVHFYRGWHDCGDKRKHKRCSAVPFWKECDTGFCAITHRQGRAIRICLKYQEIFLDKNLSESLKSVSKTAMSGYRPNARQHDEKPLPLLPSIPQMRRQHHGELGILHVPVYTFQGFTVLIESQRDFVP